ncbi:MAG: hypothetical protein DHS20C01_34250 [marine bacterium B5-7]|nr:MAG: hypothetical protein DHS20C01_34250 [marine bacterium B5-7]
MSEPTVIVFAYRDIGHTCLEALLVRGVRVVAVFTHSDDPDENIWFPSVSALADTHGIPVYKPDTTSTTEWIELLRSLSPDLIFSFYYRHLIAEDILNMARLGAFNLHGSLLPRYRGRSPINWAILNGESITGVTLHHMVKKPDAGDIVDQEPVTIGPLDSIADVSARILIAARKVLDRQIHSLLTGHAPRRPQDESKATSFSRRNQNDGRIDWSCSAHDIYNLIRAVTQPYPGAFTEVDGQRFIIWWASARHEGKGEPGFVVDENPLLISAGSGCLEVIRWQWPGEGISSQPDIHGLHIRQKLGTENHHVGQT